MNIRIEIIPHHRQRYDTAGDWFYIGEELIITVSQMKNWRHHMLVAVHELVEALICNHRQIPQEMVDSFDMTWKGEGEPGDDPAAPYYLAHQAATIVERFLAFVLNVDWQRYDAEVTALVWR